MKKKAFWAIVSDMGWGTKTTDYKALKLRVMRLGPDSGFRARYDEAMKALCSAAVEAGLDYCNDGWSDTLNHVIGLGKKEWKRNIKDPRCLGVRQDKGDYTESFGYVVPYALSFKDISSERLEQWTAETLAGFEGSPQTPTVARVVVLLKTGQLLMHEDEIRKLSELAAERSDTWSPEAPHNKWATWNLLSDLKFAAAVNAP